MDDTNRVLVAAGASLPGVRAVLDFPFDAKVARAIAPPLVGDLDWQRTYVLHRPWVDQESTLSAIARLNEASLHQAEAARRLSVLYPHEDPLALYRNAWPTEPLLATHRHIGYLDDVERAIDRIASPAIRAGGFARMRAFAGEVREAGLGRMLDRLDGSSLVENLLASERPFDSALRRALTLSQVDATMTAEIVAGLELIRLSERSAEQLQGSPFLAALAKISEFGAYAGEALDAVVDRAEMTLAWIQDRLVDWHSRAKQLGGWEIAKRTATAIGLGRFAWDIVTYAIAALAPLPPHPQVPPSQLEQRLDRLAESMERGLERLEEKLSTPTARPPAPESKPAVDPGEVEFPRPKGRPALAVKSATVHHHPNARSATTDRIATGENVYIVARTRLWAKIQYIDPATGGVFDGWVRSEKIRVAPRQHLDREVSAGKARAR